MPIIKIVDHGWNESTITKQLERTLLQPTFEQLTKSKKRYVVVNTTWYTDMHQKDLISFLKKTNVDEIVLVSMLDPAYAMTAYLPQEVLLEYAPVKTIGYYPGPGFLDFWAIFLLQYFQPVQKKDVINSQHISCPFMCLNRKPHPHRVNLYNQLKKLDLHKKGIVSLGGWDGVPVQTISNDIDPQMDLAPNCGLDQNGIPNDINSIGSIQNWQKCFLNIVTETVDDVDTSYFVSEKIYKPIIGLRPFIVYAPGGGSKWLNDRGFEHYCDDFTDITDMDLRIPRNVPEFVKILSNQTNDYWQRKFVALKSKILYNENQFYIYANQQRKKAESGMPI